MKLFVLTQRRKDAKEIFFASSHLCVIYFLLFTTSYAQKIDVPKLERYVTDQTNTLLSSETQRLEQALISFEEQTSNQITVLIIPTLGEESLEDYSIRVAEKNLIGQKKRDNGILFLIVKDDRKIRIEVGYGLEGVLTDALTSEIIRNIIAPNFRDGNYSIGIFYAVDAIMQATKGEYIGAGKKHRSRNGGNDSVLIYIIAIIAFFLFNGIFRKRRGFIGSSRGWNSSGMFLGGFGGGSGFGGFGGFSGGGGSFGGGGASGSW
ncbi:MAG: hypothetical protein FJ218_02925 [Ignavibacteria bacterium]|nr:hypothetical protein [Ignavibacteria bacterium]